MIDLEFDTIYLSRSRTAGSISDKFFAMTGKVKFLHHKIRRQKTEFITAATQRMMEELLMNFKLLGNRIRERRISQHMSQEKLAEIVDVSVTYIGAVENARKHPSLTTLVNIANALETTADFLLLGNLQHDTSSGRDELGEMLRDCNVYERYMILTLAKALKAILREGNELK